MSGLCAVCVGKTAQSAENKFCSENKSAEKCRRTTPSAERCRAIIVSQHVVVVVIVIVEEVGSSRSNSGLVIVVAVIIKINIVVEIV